MIEILNKDNNITIKPEEDITASSVDELKDIIFQQLQDNKVNIIIDLFLVTSIDSIGLSVLISCHRALQELGGHLSFVGANEDLMQLFTVLKLDKLFSISPKG